LLHLVGDLFEIINKPTVHLLRKYKQKQFLCEHNILTEGVLVTQQFSNADEMCLLQQTSVSWAINFLAYELIILFRHIDCGKVQCALQMLK